MAFLPRRQFLQFLADHPTVSLDLVKLLCQDVDGAYDRSAPAAPLPKPWVTSATRGVTILLACLAWQGHSAAAYLHESVPQIAGDEPHTQA